jgi:predicted CXXCH cytochrome family protein
MRPRFVALLWLVAALGPGCPSGAENRRLAPVAAREAKSTHGPYGSGACETCHERHDARDPGRAVRASNAVCVGCHEEFAGTAAVRLDRSIHPVNDAPCTGCHNPHNARKAKLQL